MVGHGRHPDLFADGGERCAANGDRRVFTDLRGHASSGEANESQTLDAEWLPDLIELAHTPQLTRDVRDIADDTERQHQRTALHGLRQLNPRADDVAERCERLPAAAHGAEERLPADEVLRRPLQHVAETSCAGLQVPATRDPLLNRLADVAWEVARLRVVEPSVVTLHVDELRQAQVYRPADLMGTEFRAGEVVPGAEDELVAFFDQAGTDSGSDVAERLRSLSNGAVVWHREPLSDGQGRPVALYVWGLEERALTVPVLRTSRTAWRRSLYGRCSFC